MQSSIISKIEKARRYAQEPDRVTFSDLSLKFRGSNDTYNVTYKDGAWHCNCKFFASWGTCSHTMAMQRMLSGMVPDETETLTKQLV